MFLSPMEEANLLFVPTLCVGVVLSQMRIKGEKALFKSLEKLTSGAEFKNL
jgi:hypothetical protein